jgi:hypothetical protein
MMPCAFAIPVLPSALTTASATTTVPFGAQLHGPYARCLRFANAVADAHARLASACRPPAWAVGTSTRRLLSEISGRYHPSFPTRLFLAHRQQNLWVSQVYKVPILERSRDMEEAEDGRADIMTAAAAAIDAVRMIAPANLAHISVDDMLPACALAQRHECRDMRGSPQTAAPCSGVYQGRPRGRACARRARCTRWRVSRNHRWRLRVCWSRRALRSERRTKRGPSRFIRRHRRGRWV